MGNCSGNCCTTDNVPQPRVITKQEIENILASNTSINIENIKLLNTPLISEHTFNQLEPLVFTLLIKNTRNPLSLNTSSIWTEPLNSSPRQETCPDLDKNTPIRFENGSIYKGNWKNQMRNGFGVQTWPDGSRYEGEWKDDMANGIGILIHTNGDKYEGEWLNDQASGKGRYTFSNGVVYNGDWENDKQHGFGKEDWPDGRKYEGEYKCGNKEGKGILWFNENSYYQGEFMSNEIEGKGIMVTVDKRWEGIWKNGRIIGIGKIEWIDGRVYEGEIENDEKNGFGVFDWKNGQIYIGEWKSGKQHGKGILICNKYAKIGIWNTGKRVKWINNIENQDQEMNNFKILCQKWLKKIGKYPIMYKN